MEDRWIIKSQLRRIRKFRGLKQSDIAEKLGISQEAFTRIENGNVGLTVKRLFQIAEILDCSVFDILDPVSASERETLAVKVKTEEIEKLKEELQDLSAKHNLTTKELNAIRKQLSFIGEIDLIDFEKFQKSAKFPWPPDDIIQTYPIISWMAYFAFVSTMYPDKAQYLSEFYSENKLIRYGRSLK